jgi:general secretion pathway protein A
VYQSFYGLRELPFDLTPNPRYVVLTPRHREVMSNLRYGILGRKGITLLLGEAGTGKTTLVRTVLESEDVRDTRSVYLNNPTLTRAEFVEFLARGFGLGAAAGTSKARFLSDLERALGLRRSQGIISALVIDEAQSLPHELLEEIRLLANIETATQKLLPVVLAGQPELADRLNEPSLRQLKQRVALRCELDPLDLAQTATYIADRIRIAGGDGSSVFTREAVLLIHQRSLGIPRTISVICDNALVSGFATGTRPVDAAIVSEVCRDFDLVPAPAVLPAPPPLVAREAEPLAEPTPAGSLFSSFAPRRRFSFF